MDPASLKRLKFPKAPDDVTPVTCDFSGALESIDCDTLSPTATPASQVFRNDGAPADLYVIGTPSLNTDLTRVSVWIAGGTAGFEYLIKLIVQTLDGQTLSRSFIFPCALR
jgi:hypothetical protein